MTLKEVGVTQPIQKVQLEIGVSFSKRSVHVHPGASSVLQSPDGNWIALHSSQMSRPSLLTKRKNLVFSVLEKESGVVSAYDEMGSDPEEDDKGGWGAALRQFRRKLSDETYYTDSQHDPEWTYTQHLPITSPSSGQYTNTETLNSDSEASSALSACPRKPPHNLLRKKGPPDTHLHPHHQPLYQQHLHQNLSPYRRHSEALDVNFNPKVICLYITTTINYWLFCTTKSYVNNVFYIIRWDEFTLKM